jgi:hypothetical protein
MPEHDDDDASNPDLSPAPVPVPQPASSNPAGGPPEYGGPPPPADDVAFTTEPAILLEAGLGGVKVKGSLPVASLVVAAALAIFGAILWAAGAPAPGIVLMALALIIPTIWHLANGRKTNNQRKN